MKDFYDAQQEYDNNIAQLQLQGWELNQQLEDTFHNYDPLMDRYPVFQPQIQKMYNEGFTREQISDFFNSEVMPKLNFVATPEQARNFLQQTPEGLERLAGFQHLRMMNAYKQRFHDKSDEEIFNAIELARQSGINTSAILQYPKLRQHLIAGRKESESLTEAFFRGLINYRVTNNRGDLGLRAYLLDWDTKFTLDEAAKLEAKLIQEPAVTTLAGRTATGVASIWGQMVENVGTGSLAAMVVGGVTGMLPGGKPFAKPAAQTAYMLTNGWEVFKLQAGNDYLDLLSMTDVNGKPLSKSAAWATAMITGAITAGIEMGTLSATLSITPWGKAIKQFLGMDKQIVIDAVRSSPVVRFHLEHAIAEKVKGVGVSTLNNILEAFNTGMKYDLAAAISGQEFSLDPNRHKKMWQDVKHAAGTGLDFSVTSLLQFAFEMPGVYKTTKAIQADIGRVAQEVGLPAAQVEQLLAQNLAQKQQQLNEGINPDIKAEDNVKYSPQGTTEENLLRSAEERKFLAEQVQTAEDNADYVFFPAKLLQDFISKNQGVDIQGTIDAGAEIGIPKEQYDKLRAEHPDFINENSNSIRMGANGTTADEANAKVKATDQVQAAIYHSPEMQEEIQHITADYVNAGVEQETAEITAKLAGAVMSSVKANTGVDMSFSVKTAETRQAEQAVDLSRLSTEYDITDPSTWTDQNRAQRLLAATQGKLTNMEMLIKNFLDRVMQKDTPDVELPEGVDSESLSSVIREETSDYAQTLRTANQRAVDALSASAWDAERYNIGEMPKGKSKHPDARYETIDYDGKTTIDIAAQTKKDSDNLTIRVKNPKNKNPFVLTIKDFKHADFTQIIEDIRNGVIRGGEMLANAPVLRNIGMALADFWHEHGLDKRDIPVDGGKIQKPVVDVKGGIERPVVHQLTRENIPNQLIYPSAKEMPNERADTVEAESQVFAPDVQENVAEDQDYPNSDIPLVMADNGMNALGRQNLERDQRAFEETAIERSINAGANAKTESYVMQSPLVFSLVGMPTDKIVAIKDSKIAGTSKSIMNKHSIDWPHFAQVVRELADPVAIWQSSDDSTNSDGRIFLTNMTDGDGASIVVAIQPDHKAGTKAIGVPKYNLFASMYGKSREITHGKNKGQLKILDSWFGDETANGRLLYINTEKAAQWTQRTGEDIIPQGFDLSTVKTEQDLRSLWSNPQNEGLYKLDAEGNPVTSINVNVLGDLGRSVIRILSDPSSPMQKAAGVHDVGHNLGGLVFGLGDEGHPEMQQYRDYFINRAGVTLEQWNAETPNQKGGAREKVQEWFADAFEVYMSEGAKSQDKELQGIFNKIKNFLLEIYRNITEQLGITLNDKDREIFDQLLTMPASDTDTVSEFAAQENSINAEISRVQKLKNDLVTQQQTEIQASEQRQAELDRELDLDTVEAVENYVDRDPDFDTVNQTWQNTATVRTIKGTQIEVRYKIVDADSLITSHTADGKINPDFPQDRQNRDRARTVSTQWIHKTSQHIEPQLLGTNILASDGAPIIDKSGIVESGNGRTLAIREAYQSGKAEHYRQWLIDNAHTFGLSPDEAKNLEHPVLVRERLTDVDAAKFAAEANESSIASMSKTETANTDAQKLTTDILLRMDTTKPLYENHDFIRAFMSIIPEAELADFLQKNGDISRAGLERIVSALLAKAYDNPSLLDSITEAYDSTSVNVRQALIAAAPSLAILHHSDHNSNIFLQQDIIQAVRILDQIREDGRISVQDWLAQPAIFEDADISPTARELLAFFDRNKNSYKKIASGLIYYANSAMNEATSRETLLFEDSARTKEQILSEAVKYAEQDSNASDLVQEPVSAGLFEKLTKEGKVAPTIPVNPNTYNAFLNVTGPEGLLTYLKKRRQYLKRSKKSDSHSAEIQRIDSYIKQVNETYGEQISRGKSNITTRDLRQARSESKAEGRQQEKAIQQQKQKEALAKLREQHRQNTEGLEQDFREQRIQDRADILQSRQTEQLMQTVQAMNLSDMAQADREQLQQQHAQELTQLEADKDSEIQQTVQAAEYIQSRQAMQAADYMQAKEQEIKDIKAQGKQRLKERTKYYQEKREQARAKAKEHETAKLEKAAERFGKRIAKLQKRIDNLTQAKAERNKKTGLRTAIKRIIGMGKSTSISWARHQDIQDIINTLDLDRSKKARERRELLQAFFENEDAMESQEILETEGITPEEMKEFADKVHLEDLTLGEIKLLVKDIADIYAQGKREYAIWKQQQQDRRSSMASRLVKSLGEKWKPSKDEDKIIPKSPEDIKRKWWMQNIGELGSLYWDAVQTPRRFLSSLGDAFTDILFDQATNLRNEAFEYIHQRQTFVLDSLQRLGIKPAEFMKTAVELDGNSYSWEQVMAIWAYMQNDFARDAVVYGNFMNNQAQHNTVYLTEEAALKAINTILEEINKPENQRFKDAMKVLMQDFDMNFDRINDKLIQSRNEGMEKQDNYFPILRLRHQSSGGFTIDAETEQIIQADNAGKLFQRATDGFTNSRMKINPEKQQPINLNAFGIWAKQLIQEEFLGALDEWGGDVFSALTTTGGEYGNVQDLILKRVGTPAWNIIKTIFNNTITDDAYAETEAADKIFGWLTKSRSFAMVALAPISMLSQTSSYFLAMPLTNKLHLFRSFVRGIGMAATGRGSQFLENIYRMYPELRYSGGDPVMRQVQNAKKYQNFSRWQKIFAGAYKGVQVLDNWTKCLVFDAVYQSRISDGMTHEQAMQEAIHAVQDTQPASTSREQPQFMRSRGALKFFLFQFMNSLAPVFNVAIVDVARNLASPNWNHIKAASFSLLGAGLSVAAAGGLKDLFKGKLPTGDELPDGSTDNWERWTMDTVIENLLNTAPILNGILTEWWNYYRGNKKHYSNNNRLLEPFQDIGQWWTSFWDTDNEEGTQWEKLMEGVSLLGAPIPYNGITQWMHIFGLDEGSKSSD